MNKIDTKNWKEFKVVDIFETTENRGKIQVPTGTSILKKDLCDGDVPFISVSGVNNGVCGYCNVTSRNDNKYRIYENFISVSFLGTVFYQKGKVALDMKVHCLKPLKHSFNDYTGKYMVTAILASLRESSYSDQISSTMLPELPIKLPADSNGDPDWAYMEKYMKSIEEKVCSSLLELEKVKGSQSKELNITKFKKFHLYDIFSIDSGTKLDKVKMTNLNPSINFVGRSNANNGVTDFIDEIDGLKPYDSGLMTLSLGGEYLGSCFIQNKPFYTSQNVDVLIPLIPMSYLCKQYIATMIFKEGRTRYKAFIDELNRHIKTDFSILLPVDSNGNPDWQYMEIYMKSIEAKVGDSLTRLGSVCDRLY